MNKSARLAVSVSVLSVVCVLAAAACASRSAVASSGTPAHVLTRAEQSDGWRLLFDGTTTKGWRGFKTDTVPAGWKADSGVLWKEARTRDIVSVEQFGDFELSLEWKIAPAGNAGLFYRGTEEYNRIYWSGPEYQLLDDSLASDNKIEDHRAGSAYGLYAPPRGVVKPANEWNVTRVVAKGAHVEHWLNGRKVVEYEIGSPDWEAKVKASKFAVWPNYGRAKRGHIAIQGDHNGRLELRNIKIRELK